MSAKRVLVIGPHGTGQLPASFASAFARLGYDVARYDSDRAYFDDRLARHRVVRRIFRARLWDRMNAETIDLVRQLRPAMVLAVKGTYLHPGTVREIRTRVGVPIANYYSDNPYCGMPLNPRKSSVQRRDLIDALREYSRVWIWEPAMADRLSADGVAAAYLPFGVDPDASRGSEGSEPRANHEVVFIGQHSGKREAHVAAIREHRASLWGSRWQRSAATVRAKHDVQRESAFGRRCAEIYAAATVALNIVDDLNMPGHNMRTFEIPAAGGLMLATYTEEQAALFPEGEAALYYRSPSELDHIISRVQSEPALRQRIRVRAQAIAATHDYAVRAAAMARELAV